MASQPRRRQKAVDVVEEMDGEDFDAVVELGTDIALAVFQALVSNGVSPDEAVIECWKYPERFLTARQAWAAAMDHVYGS